MEANISNKRTEEDLKATENSTKKSAKRTREVHGSEDAHWFCVCTVAYIDAFTAQIMSKQILKNAMNAEGVDPLEYLNLPDNNFRYYRLLRRDPRWARVYIHFLELHLANQLKKNSQSGSLYSLLRDSGDAL